MPFLSGSCVIQEKEDSGTLIFDEPVERMWRRSSGFKSRLSLVKALAEVKTFVWSERYHMQPRELPLLAGQVGCCSVGYRVVNSCHISHAFTCFQA